MGRFGNSADEAAQEAVEAEGVAWPVPWHAQVPGIVLSAAMAAAFVATLYSRGFHEGMTGWATSAAVLREGRVWTLVTHMFAHGGIMHILMNLSVLVAIGPALTARLGAPPLAWLRFLALFVLSGLAGVLLFLAVHPMGETPMLGASGAIYGLFGVLVRLRPDGGLVPIRSREMGRVAVDFVKGNLFLILLLTVPAILSGSGGGVAWEAHLGGFLLGLFAGPRFVAPWTPEQDI